MVAAKGQKTEPRRLQPLLLRGMHETIIDRKLQARVHTNEELPPLNLQVEGGQAFGLYLRRREVWKRLRAQAENQRQLQRVTGLNCRTIVMWWDRLETLLRKVVQTSPIKALHHQSQFSMAVLVLISLNWLFLSGQRALQSQYRVVYLLKRRKAWSNQISIQEKTN